MAYDVKRDEERPEERPEERANPYEGLTKEVDSTEWSPKLAPTAMPGADAGPTVTGRINFDQIYNANLGTSTREANRLQTSARQKGGAVRTGVSGAVDQFGAAVRTGSTQGPTQAHQGWAKTASTGVTAPPKPGEAVEYDRTDNPDDPWDGEQSFGEQAYILGPDGKPLRTPDGGYQKVPDPLRDENGKIVRGPDGNPISKSSQPAAPPPVDPAVVAAQKAQEDALKGDVERGAGAEYSGPGSLSDLDNYAQLTRDAAAAEDLADALGRGNEGVQALGLNQLDASLVGAAGRPKFEEVGKKYGDLQSELARANASSMAVGNQARRETDDAAAAYRALLGEYDGRVDADNAALGKYTNEKAAREAKFKTAAENKAKFKDYREGGSDIDKVRNVLHSVGGAFSPSEMVTGNKGLVSMGTNFFSPMSSTNKGNVWSGWADDDYEVWASMQDSDWDEFAGMSDSEKRAWIAARKKQLRGGK